MEEWKVPTIDYFEKSTSNSKVKKILKLNPNLENCRENKAVKRIRDISTLLKFLLTARTMEAGR